MLREKEISSTYVDCSFKGRRDQIEAETESSWLLIMGMLERKTKCSMTLEMMKEIKLKMVNAIEEQPYSKIPCISLFCVTIYVAS